MEINKTKIQKARHTASLLREDVGQDPAGIDDEIRRASEEKEKLDQMVRYFRDRFPDVEVFHPQLWASFYEN